MTGVELLRLISGTRIISGQISIRRLQSEIAHDEHEPRSALLHEYELVMLGLWKILKC